MKNCNCSNTYKHKDECVICGEEWTTDKVDVEVEVKEELIKAKKKLANQSDRRKSQIERLEFSLGYEKGKSSGFNYAIDLIDSILERLED